MMYYQVQQLQRDGLSVLAIAEFLGMNRRTVAKYLAMSEAEFENFLVQKNSRTNYMHFRILCKRQITDPSCSLSSPGA